MRGRRCITASRQRSASTMNNSDLQPGEGRVETPASRAGTAAATIVDGFQYPLGDGGDEPRSVDEDILVCWHEASHAVIGRQLHAAALGGCTVEGGLDYSGLTWGPAYVRQAKFSDSQDDVPTLCSQLTGVMPRLGESRTDCAAVYLHCFHRVVELVSGTEGERLFLDSEPWFACDDERQAIAYASLVTSSPASAAALISACRIEAASLLEASAHVVCALALQLRRERTMDGTAIDSCIEGAVAEKALADEHARRANWKLAEKNAAVFAARNPLALGTCSVIWGKVSA
jgi:hypothetical protein